MEGRPDVRRLEHKPEPRARLQHPRQEEFVQNEKIRVLIADDNELFREGLISLLGECQSVDVVGQARDGWQAIEKTHILRPDVILMDVSMPRMDGVTATQRIK